jgi:peptidoglycan/LPS O-acetylase OafA/YrhL
MKAPHRTKEGDEPKLFLSSKGMQTKRRLPSLDGLRAIFLCLVVYVHLRTFSQNVDIQYAIGFGGIFVFFVMSGFIITRLLLEEREQTGEISLSAFYCRRCFRIFPGLLGYLCGIALLRSLGLTSCSVRALLWGLTFLGNYHPSSFSSVGHLWSLCVEEQFYLVWPFVFSRVSIKNASRILLVVVCAAPIVRLILLAQGADWGTLHHHSESVADSIAMGCLLAIVQPRLHANRAYQWFSRSYLCLLVPVVALTATWERSPLFYQGLEKTILFLSIAVGIDISIQRSESIWGRVLNNAVLVRLGLWSYSLYLWQQVFTLQQPGTQPYAWFPMNLALTLSIGIVSYYLIERPSLKWGRTLTARRQDSIVAEVLAKTV